MIKKPNFKFNIDKLKLCFDDSNNLYSLVINNELPKEYNGLYFNVYNTDSISCYIDISVIEEDKFISLGTLIVSQSLKYSGLAFFVFNNKPLYTITNIIEYINKIMDFFGLVFRSVTEIEIACDVPNNIIRKIRKYIRDIENYDLYLNGKRVKDNETLEDYGEFYSRTRKQITRKPTLYFKQKDNSFGLRIYDKSTEIQSSNKDYINTDSSLYRCELWIKNKDIREFVKTLHFIDGLEQYGNLDNLLDYIQDTEFLQLLWFRFSNRVIYFVDKHTKMKLTLSDICKVSNENFKLLK